MSSKIRRYPSTKALGVPQGYRMPGEWEPHQATWLAWPHNPNDWPGKFPPIPWVYADIVRHLVSGEDVHIFVQDASHRKKAEKVLRDSSVELSRVRFHIQPTDRVWTRDSGAIFIRGAKGKVAATTWRFNAWAKYDDWKRDRKVSSRMAKEAGVSTFAPMVDMNGKRVPVVLEGGSIDVNGRGTLLTTEECLLSDVQQRNPGVSRPQIERVFADYLGVTNVIWLKRGIVGDDTHGHVDDITRFVAVDSVVTVVEENKSDENYEITHENLAILKAAKGQDGKLLKVHTIPMPSPMVFKEQRLPASYANFYIANACVLVPTFNDPNDRLTLNKLAELFPSRKVIGIHCGDFVWGLGTLHCMTQQQPKAK